MSYVQIVDMFDFIGLDKAVQRIAQLKPKKVAGYDTEERPTDGIKWTAEDWALFPDTETGHVHIDQSLQFMSLAKGISDVGDVETGTGTIDAFINAVVQRWENFKKDTTLYTQASNADRYHQRLTEKGVIDHVDWWVADWSLNKLEAASRVGKNRVVAVQWASPSSNPRTLVPGSQTMTLSAAGVDLSMALASWHGPVQPVKPPVSTVSKAEALRFLAGVTQYVELS